MRKLGFSVAGFGSGAIVAALFALPQSDMSRAVDPQGLHLIGVLFLIMPVAAVVGLILGLLTEHLTRQLRLDGPSAPTHGSGMLHLMIPVSFYWTCAT